MHRLFMNVEVISCKQNMFGVLCLIVLFFAKAHSDVIVTLPDGKVQGVEKISLRNRTFYSFFHVPFAQPPLGNLRFRDPEPVQRWTGILDATKETSICYQMSSNSDMEKEDCLYLNVYTPVVPTKAVSLPVMLYIHGGGFLSGHALYSRNGPHHFMDNDVVIVTIAYRLGPFGFLSTQDSVIPGNYGLKDQTMALKWVQRNIASFGGDPNKVVIMGQSSGAVSVGYQIISKQSKGLFSGAIQQSGGVLTPHGYQRNARSYAYKLAKLVDPNFTDEASSKELLSLLQNATAQQIRDAAVKLAAAEPWYSLLSEGSWFAPVIENESDDAFITKRMYSSLESGDFNRVPLMVGITSEESISQAADLVAFKANVARYDNNLTLLVQADMHIQDQKKKSATGEAIRKIYTKDLLQDDLGSAVRYFSDAYVSRPVIRHAEMQAAYGDVYFYQFSYDGPLGNNSVHVQGAENVTHSEDMMYLWVTNETKTINDIRFKDLLTLDRYVKMFTNFARTLNPTPDEEELLDNVVWLKMVPSARRYLDIGEELSVRCNPKEPAYTKWVDIYNTMAVKPFDTF